MSNYMLKYILTYSDTLFDICFVFSDIFFDNFGILIVILSVGTEGHWAPHPPPSQCQISVIQQGLAS